MANTTRNKSADKEKSIPDKTIMEYANDPFFAKKRENALKFIKKAGLPDSFAKKKK